jgi:hypothetical protein
MPSDSSHTPIWHHVDKEKEFKGKKRLAYNKPEQSSSNSEGTFPPTRMPSVIVYRAGGGLGEA